MLESNLASCFEIKDLGALQYFFGIKVASSPKSYLLSQSKYTIDILNWARVTNSKTIDNPLEVNVRYSSSDGKPLLDRTLYRTIVGNLVYLTITYSDIDYDVHIISQFVDSLTIVYWVAILHILWYLWGIIFQKLLFPPPSSLELYAYFDADWANDPEDQKSTTRFYIFLGDSLISWKSKKQTIVSQSSMEAKYRVMTSTTSEIVWLHWLLLNMRVSLSCPTLMYCDNKSAI